MNGEYRLRIGDLIVGVRCVQTELAVGLANWFGLPSDAADPHLVLDLELVPHDDSPELPRSLLTTKTLGPDGSFDIAGGLIRGRFDRGSMQGELQVKAVLVTGRYPRILEQIFYQAHESAREAGLTDGRLVHSSAVIAEGAGHLFVGPSGAGKSTVAELSAGHHVLGDEMNLVVPRGDGHDVVGTPFNGTFRAKRPGRAPLVGIYLLKHGSGHSIGTPAEAASVSALASEIVPPVGLDEVPDEHTLPDMVDAAATLAAKSGLKELRFTPDAGFWDAIAADRERGRTRS